jgi:hypothetical protein
MSFITHQKRKKNQLLWAQKINFQYVPLPPLDLTSLAPKQKFLRSADFLFKMFELKKQAFLTSYPLVPARDLVLVL